MAAVAKCAGRTVAGRAVQRSPCGDGLLGCRDEETYKKDGGSVALAPSRRVGSVTGSRVLSQRCSSRFP